MTLRDFLLIQNSDAVAQHLRWLSGASFLLFFMAGEDGQVVVQASFLLLGAALLGASEIVPGLVSEVRRRRQAVARGARQPGPINWPEKPSSPGSSRGGRPGAPRRNTSRSRPRTRPGGAARA